jgi:DNA-binding HxlR family transcriptional regulator
MSTSDSNNPVTQREWSSVGVNTVVRLIAGRGVLPPILQALDAGPLRRNALRQRVGAVSEMILRGTLRRMEVDSLIRRTLIERVSVEVDDGLTPFGRHMASAQDYG